MADIKISGLATKADLILTDLLAVSNTDGTLFKSDLQTFANLFSTVSGVAFKGVLTISEAAATDLADGFYFPSESGNYVLANSVTKTVALTNNLVILIVGAIHTTLDMIVNPVTVSVSTTFDETNNTIPATQKASFDKFNPLIEENVTLLNLGATFYTLTTAIAEVSNDIKKVGLSIVFQIDAENKETWQFTNNNISNFSNVYDWKRTDIASEPKLLIDVKKPNYTSPVNSVINDDGSFGGINNRRVQLFICEAGDVINLRNKLGSTGGVTKKMYAFYSGAPDSNTFISGSATLGGGSQFNGKITAPNLSTIFAVTTEVGVIYEVLKVNTTKLVDVIGSIQDIADLKADLGGSENQKFKAENGTAPEEVTNKSQLDFDKNLYNITREVPLNSGFYTFETALNAVVNTVKKVGLELTFSVSADKTETWKFISNDVANFNDKFFWENLDLFQEVDLLVNLKKIEEEYTNSTIGVNGEKVSINPSFQAYFYEAIENDVIYLKSKVGSAGPIAKLGYAFYNGLPSSSTFISGSSVGGALTFNEKITMPANALYFGLSTQTDNGFEIYKLNTKSLSLEIDLINESIPDLVEFKRTQDIFNYPDAKTLNLANASMRCNFGNYSVVNENANTDVGCGLFSDNWTTSGYKPDVDFSQKIEGLAGFGISRIPNDLGFRIAIPISANDILVSQTNSFTTGFWFDKTDMVSVNTNNNDSANDRLLVTDGSGNGFRLITQNLVVGFTDSRDSGKQVVTITELINKTINGSVREFAYLKFEYNLQSALNYALIIVAKFVDTSKTWRLHNYTYFSSIKKINPYIEYPTLYSLFGSNLVGKTIALTGDSNGGAGVGTFKRLSWAARYLGVAVINASNGGWSMQGRVIDNESNNFGWLFYHKWRAKIIASNADIYYFNQCTNDGYKERASGYPDNVGGTDFGTFGTGLPDSVKLVIDTYTPAFKTLLEAGNMNALYLGETLTNICRRDMTTFGCTGAFIAEVTEKQPKALCITDSTISAMEIVNTLLGGFNAGGIVESSVYESDNNKTLVYPPYLLTDVDSDNMPLGYISNGTLTGATAVTNINSGSTLSDGNNYALYNYYAFKNFNKTVGTDVITPVESDAIGVLVHAYYVDNDTVFGRLDPFKIQVTIEPLIFNVKKIDEYYKSTANLKNWLQVPFIDAGGNSGRTSWNAPHISGDSGHYKANGMRKLGTYIANSLNNLFTFENSDFAAGFEDYDKESGLN